MKYDLTARAFPFLFDRTVMRFLADKDSYDLKGMKKKIHRQYKEMVRRTPGLSRDDDLTGNLYTGCYTLSVYNACEGKMPENDFRDLIISLCHCKAMEKAHRKLNAFSDDQLQKKKNGAATSDKAKDVMSWKYSFDYREGAQSYNLTYYQCGLCTLGKQEHLEHLIKYMCLADFITFEMMGAKLSRTQTLAEGGSCCDFHVVKMKERLP